MTMLNIHDVSRKHEQNKEEGQKFVSIIIPTFNESMNIINLLNQLQSYIPKSMSIEIIVVDDNSPDSTGYLVEKYIQEKKQVLNSTYPSSPITLKIIHRKMKNGLISAILNGIKSSKGQNIIVMDADFSHPPTIINQMISELKKEPNCIVVGSRYINGGAIKGMSIKRLLFSIGANFIARHGLCLKNVHDPMSGFFAFPKHILQDIEFNTNGFKILLEILIKKKNTIKVKEIPYTFEVRKHGYSKLDNSVIIEYIKAIWKLYRYGRKTSKEKDKSHTATDGLKSDQSEIKNTANRTFNKTLTGNNMLKLEQKKSVRFISKAARFYTVGASGFVLNYLISMILSNGTIANLDYLQAISIGIGFSVTTNFLLNKFWTFEDKNILPSRFIKQYGSFIGCSSLGIIIQFLSVFMFKEAGMTYDISLLLGVTIASVSNFLFNKKWTFKENIWD